MLPSQPLALSAKEGKGLPTHVAYSRKVFPIELTNSILTGKMEETSLLLCGQNANETECCPSKVQVTGRCVITPQEKKRVMKAHGQKEHSVPKISISPGNEKDRQLIWPSRDFEKTEKIYFVTSIISLYSWSPNGLETV